MTISEEQFKELFKEVMEKVRNVTIQSLLDNDSVYNADTVKQRKAEEKYNKLVLTKDQREICNELIHLERLTFFEYAENAYLAGINDGIRMISVISPPNSDYDWIKEVLFTKD